MSKIFINDCFNLGPSFQPFSIPVIKPPTGPTGPTGPAGPLAFAFVYQGSTGGTGMTGFTAAQILNPCTTPPTTGQFVDFNAQGPTANIIWNGSDSLLLTQSGVYEAEYKVTGIPETSAMSFKLVQTPIGGTGTTIPGSVYYSGVSTNGTSFLVGDVKFGGNAGDTIQLANNTDSTVILQSNPGISSIPPILGNHVEANNVGTSVSAVITVLQGSSIYVGLTNTFVGSPTTMTANGTPLNEIAGTSNIGNNINVSIWNIDNLAANTYTITTTFGSSVNVIMEVAEFRNTANPSLDNTSSNTGTGTLASVALFSNTSNEIAFGVVGVDNNGAHTTQIQAIPPSINVDNATTTTTVASGDFTQPIVSGSAILQAAIINPPSPSNWAAAGVAIKGLTTTTQQLFCDPPNNASLDIKLI